MTENELESKIDSVIKTLPSPYDVREKTYIGFITIVSRHGKKIKLGLDFYKATESIPTNECSIDFKNLIEESSNRYSGNPNGLSNVWMLRKESYDKLRLLALFDLVDFV